MTDNQIKKIKQLLLETGLSSKDFAERIDKNPVTVSKYLNNKSDIPYKELQRICTIMNWDINWIMVNTEVSEPQSVYSVNAKGILERMQDQIEDLQVRISKIELKIG